MIYEISVMTLILSSLRIATPLIFASLAGLFSEKSGTVQIGLEGFMLSGALAAAIVAHFTHSPWLGFIAGGCAGSLLAIFFSFFVLKLKSNQIITGMAFNILVMGIAPFITKILFDSTGSTPSLDLEERFSYEPILICAGISAFAVYLINKTRFGLWIHFAGESTETLLSAGISYMHVRFYCLMITGFLAGMGGATLSLFLASSYSPLMTAGRGFMALAALIFGRWSPGYSILACLFFAFVDAIQIQLQSFSLPIPVQFIQILPYVITIVALSGFFGKNQVPRMLGNNS